MLDWALRYIDLGWPVFPLGVRSKMPMIPKSKGGRGCLDATTDEAQVLEWWKKWPNANIGLVTGVHFFAVDVDAHRGGEDTWDNLRTKHPRLPETPEQTTGRGGKQILYGLPANFRVQNSQDFIGPGIDVRGLGGFIVAPSIHPITGVAYVWDGAVEVENQRIADAPQWVLNIVRGHQDGKGSDGKGSKSTSTPAKIAEGARNDTLFREGCRLRRIGWQEEEIFKALAILNAERCARPLLDSELRTIANSAAKYTPAASIAENVGTPAASPQPAVSTAVAFVRPYRQGKVFSIDSGRDPACWPDDPIGSPPSMPSGNLIGPRALLPRGTALALNDSGNAERLRIVYGNDLLWCYEFQEWMVFHNGVWERSDDLARVMASRVIAMTKWQADQVGIAAVRSFLRNRATW